MRLKIKSKLVAVNFIIIFLIVISQIVVQNIFFHKYYKDVKSELLTKRVITFKEKLENGERTDKYIEDVLQKDEVLLAYLDENMGIVKGIGSETGRLVLITDENEEVILHNVILSSNDMFFSKGEYVEIKFIEDKENGSIYIKEIEKDGYEEKIVGVKKSNGKLFKEILGEEKIIKGYVKNYIGGNKGIGSYRQEFRNILEGLKSLKLGSEKDIKIMIGTKMIFIKRFNERYIAGVVVVEGEKDILNILNGFNMFILLPNLILAIIIIYIFSKRITKPLIQMKDFAESIAHENYDEKISVKSNDELGDLGESLNDISGRLNDYMLKMESDYKEKLEREKSHKFLLMNISHDLKTPLTIIKGYLKAIKDGIYDKEEYIDYTIEGVDEITETLTEMLELSKLKSQGFELEMESVDFTRLIYKTLNKLRPVSKEKNQEIEMDILDDVFLYMDEGEMKKVLENIIMNGIKYSPEEAKIKVTLKECEKVYLLSVENEGVHIPAEEIENIFEEFYRGDKARNKINGGNGLGLAIVKTILENHKFKYDLKNTDKGVLFTLFFNKDNK